MDNVNYQNIRICFIKNEKNASSETFIRAQEVSLPCTKMTLFGELAKDETRSYLSNSIISRAFRAIIGKFFLNNERKDVELSYLKAFRCLKPNVVVAQYGPVGVRVLSACKKLGIPLIVYFRGYDAYDKRVLSKYYLDYMAVFEYAFAIVAVSHQIREKLIVLGADPVKVIYQPSGVDCNAFPCINAGENKNVFLAVGRFVEKKAPHLTLLAFYEALKILPNLQLRIIGDGPLRGVCRDLVESLNMGHAIFFLGEQSHEEVIKELSCSRGFIQHSVMALNGDCEGTPNSIMEASAACLPVLSTRHAGINDVVIEGKTGYLVEEFDVFSMANHIVKVALNPDLATLLGRAGRDHVSAKFRRDDSHGTLLELACKAINISPVNK